MATDRATVVSAPGKVLIAGGYLVLEPSYPGLVISTSARFYTVVRSAVPPSTIVSSSSSSSSSSSRPPRIRIHSPQFIGADWEYLVEMHDEQETCRIRQTRKTFESKEAGKNPFVALSVMYALRLALEATSAVDVLGALGANGLDIAVLADNDFYSQRAAQDDAAASTAPTSNQLRSLPAFNAQSCAIRDVHKTGLGSSAAMTTSLVGALLLHLGVVHAEVNGDGHTVISDDEALALVHNTAQLAHCAAQGKVGSGFDVSAAVWGSQLYRRFDKAAIQAVLDAGEAVGVEGEEEEVEERPMPEPSSYLDPRNPLWHPSPLSNGVQASANPTAVEGLASASAASHATVARPAPLELPPHVQMMLADVDAGSNTPSMVGQIAAWRESKPEWAQQMWAILASANQTLADGLLALRLAHAQDSAEYDAAIALASQRPSKGWDALAKTEPSATLSLLVEVRNAMRSVQGGMRELGRQAGVPVEPNEMGNVIKATIDGANGVLGGGVPGAGGYDALFVLFLQPSGADLSATDVNSSATEQIERVWSEWTALSVGPLLSRAGGAAGVISSADQVRQALLVQGAPPSMPALASGQSNQPGGLIVHALASVTGLHEAIERGARQ